LKLEALRLDVQTGVSSIRAGRISRVTPEQIIEKAKTRGLISIPSFYYTSLVPGKGDLRSR